MENIISLADIITRQKVYQAQLVDEFKDNENKMAQLYNLVIDGKIKSDDDALEFLYNGKGDIDSLKKLKSRLYDRMINSIFFLDQTKAKYKDINTAAINCYKNFAAIKLLGGNRKLDLACELAEKTIKKSMRFEFTDLNYMLSAFLSSYYLKTSSSPIKFKKYSKLKSYYVKALIAETEIDEIYSSLAHELSKTSGGLDPEIEEYYKSKLPEIKEQQQEIKTKQFNLYAYLFQANLYLETKEYNEIINVSKEGMAFFESKGIKSLAADFTLRSRAGLANFLLKQYKTAEDLFKKNMSITSPVSTNHYAMLNFLFSLYVVQKKYDKVYEVIATAFNNKDFEKRVHPLLVQLFKVKEAYTHFLIDLGKIDPENIEEHSLRKFRLGRFLNDTPSFSKDKRGVNISILVIQLILLVQTKKYDQIIDKLDALNMYCHRYLRADKTFRSNCFIKMLMKLPDADYHPIRWARYVKKFRTRLDEHPFELSYHNLDLEVIPYEHLYDLVLEMLEKQKGIYKTAS